MNTPVLILSNAELTRSVETRHPDDSLLMQELYKEGLDSHLVAWEDYLNLDFDADAIILRTTWGDYNKIPSFKKMLQKISRTRSMIWNPVELVRWNLNKKYLVDLQRAGLPVVRTKHIPQGQSINLHFLWEEFEAESLILKPAISTSASQTIHLNIESDVTKLQAQLKSLRHQDVLVQHFEPNILSEGEYSLIFISGQFTHGVLKRGFRVHEEQEASIQRCSAPPSAIRTAQRILHYLQDEWLYARVDLVRESTDNFLLTGLELVGSQLFFSFCKEAATLMAQSISKRI